MRQVKVWHVQLLPCSCRCYGRHCVSHSSSVALQVWSAGSPPQGMRYLSSDPVDPKLFGGIFEAGKRSCRQRVNKASAEMQAACTEP